MLFRLALRENTVKVTELICLVHLSLHVIFDV